MEIVNLYIKEVEHSDQYLNDLLNSVPNSELNRVATFKSISSKINSLTGRKIVHDFLVKDFNYKGFYKEVEVDKYGKPFVNRKDFSFNISHSGNIVAVVLMRGEYVLGVDVEKPRSLKPAVIERVFTDREQKSISSHNFPENEFIRLWTRKESVVKAIGKGISMGLSDIDVIDDLINIESNLFSIQGFEKDTYQFSVAANKNFKLLRIDL